MSVTIPIAGGKTYTRNYEDDVEIHVKNIKYVLTELNKYSDDHIFYIKKFQQLLNHAPLDLLPGNSEFQILYNAQLINTYLCSILQSDSYHHLFDFLNLNESLYKSLKKTNADIGNYYHLYKLKKIKNGGKISINHNHNIANLLNSIKNNSVEIIKYIDNNMNDIDFIHKNIISNSNKLYKSISKQYQKPAINNSKLKGKYLNIYNNPLDKKEYY